MKNNSNKKLIMVVIAISVLAIISVLVAVSVKTFNIIGDIDETMGVESIEEVEVKIGDVVGTHTIVNDNESNKTVLMLHGFASSRDEVGELYKILANELSKEGINSLRIDFRGYGDTTVPSYQSTIDTMIEDAQNSYKFLENIGVEDIAIQGFSLGSEIAILTFAENENVKNMVLWSAPEDLSSLKDGISNEDLEIASTEGKVNIDLGFREIELSREFFDSLENYDIKEQFSKYSNNVMFISGKDDDISDAPENLKRVSDNENIEIQIIPNTGHIFSVFESEEVSKGVIEITVNVLKK